MSWAVGFDDNWKRDIGYGVPAFCEHPRCAEKIDRGLGYACGGRPYGGEKGCGLFFCGTHLGWNNLCSRCRNRKSPFSPKPDTIDWVEHKATHPSWAEWRKAMTTKKPPTACSYPFVDDGWHWRCRAHIDAKATCCGCGKKFKPTSALPDKPKKARKR